MSKTTLTLLVPIMIAGLLLPGCGTGQDRRAETASTTAEVSVDISKSTQDLDAVLASLTNLRAADGDADLKKLHADLKKNTAQLDNSLGDVASSSEAAEKAGKAQNEAWHKQANTFSDAQLRDASQKRQNDLRIAVDALAKSNNALKGERSAFMSQLNQTVSALDLDLTTPGVEAIRPVIAKLVDNEGKLRHALADVEKNIKAERAVINP